MNTEAVGPSSDRIAATQPIRSDGVSKRSNSPISPPSTLPKPSVIWEEFSAVLKAASLLGAFVSVVYFLRIGYMPVDSVSGVTALGALVAMLAAMLTVLTATFWLPLTLMWFGATSRPDRNLVRSTFGGQSPDAPVRVGSIVAFNLWSIGAPWLIVTALILPSEYLLYGNKWWAWLYALPLVYGLSLGSPAATDHRGEWLWFSVLQAVTACLAPLALAAGSLFWSLDSDRETQSTVLVLTGIVPIAINTCSLYMLAKAGERTIAPIGIAFAATVAGGFIVCFVLADATRASNGLMRTLSVRYEQVTLVLKGDACDEARLLGLPLTEIASQPGSTRDAACLVSEATVLSALGERWRLATSGRERHAVSIRSADVVALRSPKPAK